MGYAYPPVPIKYDGVVDADGHVLEPIDLWTEYIENKYKDRTLRLAKDDEGYEYLEIAGKPSKQVVKGMLGVFGAMGQSDTTPRPGRDYMNPENTPYGARNAEERLDLLDKEHLDKALLYPTVSLTWEAECNDGELALAYTRAYNRWVADFCRSSDGRLVAIAHISLTGGVESAAAELERAVKDGCKGGFVHPFTQSKVAHGDPSHDPLWAKAQELDVPMAIHPTTLDMPSNFSPRFRLDPMAPVNQWYLLVLALQATQQAFVSMFAFGALDRFPALKFGILEVQSGWIGSMLDRMDAIYEGHYNTLPMPLKDKPSTYFKRQCFVSGDPDEASSALVMDYAGPQCFAWASDYPHFDHTGGWVKDLEELVEPLSAETRQAMLGGNINRIYKLS